MLHDLIYRLLVFTCHYTSGTLFFSKRPDDIPRPWDKEEEGDEDEGR